MKFMVQGLIGNVYRNAAGYHLSVVVPCPKEVDLDFTPIDIAVTFDDKDVGKAMRAFAAEGLDNCWPIEEK